jgi:hypothetical protein
VCVLAITVSHGGCSADQSSVFEPDASAASGTAAGQGGGGGAGLSSGQGGDVSFTGSGGAETGCEKVDFLFIVDNSVSMQDQQAALIASFPSFISTIQSTIKAASDYHLMVVDTDAETRCTAQNCQSGGMNAFNLCKNTPDGGYACNTQFEPCDSILGAGVRHPAGKGASNKLCSLVGGQRYIVEAEPDKASAFSCIAQVGLAGHPAERPMDALVAAMASDINAPGGCNAGFLREDAILVLTFISDDPNVEDAGTPQDWYDAVVAAKGGNNEAVAVLGFTPAFPGCSGSNPDKGKHWSEFIALWGDRGLEVSVCEQDFGPPFAQAVSIIDETCDDFTPPK